MGFNSRNKKRATFGGDIPEVPATVEEDILTEEITTQPAKTAQAPTQTNAFASHIAGSVEMKILHPTSLSDCTVAAQHVMSGRTVLLNLDRIDDNYNSESDISCNGKPSKRFIAFMSGMVFALSGSLKQTSDDTYIVAPSNVSVTTEEPEEAVATEPTEEPVTEAEEELK